MKAKLLSFDPEARTVTLKLPSVHPLTMAGESWDVTQPKRIRTEEAKCAGCGKPFTRRADTSNRRQFCDAPKCQRILKIRNSVASFDTLQEPTMSIHRADIQYHGTCQ